MRNTGRKISDTTRERIAHACTGIPNALKGLTFEEFYGPKRAEQLAREHSRKLKEGYASGRLRFSGRPRYAPIHRGIRLRSKLELRAIEHLERIHGLVLGETLLYEDPATFVRWTDANGIDHTYMPDLHDTVNRIVYEVKPARLIVAPTDEMQRKFAALRARMHRVAYLSDEDLRREHAA